MPRPQHMASPSPPRSQADFVVCFDLAAYLSRQENSVTQGAQESQVQSQFLRASVSYCERGSDRTLPTGHGAARWKGCRRAHALSLGGMGVGVAFS